MFYQGMTVAVVVLLAGCASQPERIRSATISEAGHIALSEREEERRIDHLSSPSSSTTSSESGAVTMHLHGESRSGGYSGSESSLPIAADPEIRLWLGRRLPEVGRPARYVTEWGYELGGAFFWEEWEISGNLFFADVKFDEENAEILRDPGIFGWELSAGLRWSLYQHLSFHAGLGISNGWLYWRYANPLTDGNEQIRNDALGYFGLFAPVSLQSHFGPIMTEFVALPTIRFGYDYSEEGFENDVTRFYRGIPYAIRLGYVF